MRSREYRQCVPIGLSERNSHCELVVTVRTGFLRVAVFIADDKTKVLRSLPALLRTMPRALKDSYHTGTGSTILFVDPDDAYATPLLQSLKTEGYRVERVKTGEAAIAWLRARQPDLMILDLALPNATGFEVLREYRAMEGRAAVLVLAVREHEVDAVQALRLGADDYVAKTTGLLEILARVQAGLRRVRKERARPLTEALPRITFGDVSVDVRARTVTRHGVPVDLTPLEFDLLVNLIQNEGAIVTRDQLLRQVWQYSHGLVSRTVDQHMSRLRIKLEADPKTPAHLVTVFKSGYRFQP